MGVNIVANFVSPAYDIAKVKRGQAALADLYILSPSGWLRYRGGWNPAAVAVFGDAAMGSAGGFQRSRKGRGNAVDTASPRHHKTAHAIPAPQGGRLSFPHVMRTSRRAGECPEWQRGRTVNPLAYAFVGSSPTSPTIHPRLTAACGQGFGAGIANTAEPRTKSPPRNAPAGFRRRLGCSLGRVRISGSRRHARRWCRNSRCRPVPDSGFRG